MSGQIFNLMRTICSAHQKRGEEVKEFNLSPHFYDKFTVFQIAWQGKLIPIVCKNWIKIDGYWCYELTTTEGVVYVKDIVYKTK